MAELTTDAFGTTSELDPSAFGTTPTEAKKPEGDYLRGLKKYAPQMQEMYGAGKALAGKAIDSESLIKSGIATMQDANRKVQEIGTKPTDEWTGVNSVGDAIDWAQHGLGQVTGNLAESAVAAGAGTLLGGLGANPLTAAAGGVTGLLGKSIVKGALKDQAEAIAAKYGAQEAEKFIAKGMAEDVAKKTIGRTIGQNVGIAGMAGFHGVGETGSRAFQEAGYDPSQVELGQVLPRAAGHAAAEFLGDKILLGGMLGKGAYRAAGEGAYPMVKTVAGNMAIVAGKEIPVELVQTVLERDAAKLELMSPEARDEYINTVAQTFLFGIAGAPAGVRSYLSGKRATEPLPTPAPVTPEQTAQQKILNTELGGATDAFVRNIPSEQKLLPPGVITVPNNAGGETVIDANAGPIQGAAVAAVTNSTIAEDIASGIPLKGYSPDQAKAELASRPDAERYEIRPHPVSGDRGRVAIVPKPAQALAEIDAKASAGNEAMARSEQLAAEEGTRKQLAQVAKDIQAAQKQAIDLHRSAASIEKSITPSTPPQDAAIAREQATELRSQAAAIQTQIQTARAAATQQATQGVRQQTEQNAPATEQALAQDAAQQELAPAVAQPLSETPANQAIAKQRTQHATQQAGVRAQQLAQEEVGDQPAPTVKVPRPMKVGGLRASRYSDEHLQAVVGNDSVPATSRRAAAAEIAWRQAEAEAAAQAEIAKSTGKASTRRAGESESDWLYRKAAEKNAAKAAQQMPSAPVSEVDAKDLEVVGRAVKTTGDLGLSIIREDAMPDMDKAGPKEVSKQSAIFMRHVAKLFGKEIVFVGGMNEDGFYQSGNKIYLSTKSNINQLRVLGHEMLHALKRQNRASYDKLLEAVGAIATDAQLKAQFKDYFALDAEMSQKTDAEIDTWLGDKANRDMMLEEMMADLSGNRFAESAFWESVFTKIDAKYGSEQSKGIIAKLRLALVAALNKLMSLVKGGQFSVDARVSEHLESIREALATGFADYAKAVKDKQISESGVGEVKFSKRKEYGSDYEQRKTVSTTVPTPNEKKKRTNNPITEDWVIDTKDIEASQNHMSAVANAVAKYNTILSDPSQGYEVLAELRKVVVDNLLKLHDMMPPAIRERAKLWYDGANVIANQWSELYGITDRQAAGVLAVFSPQMDWFKNVSLAERAIAITKNRREESWSPEMTAWTASYVEAAATLKEREDRLRLLDDAKRLEGKAFKYMSLSDKARFVRIFDETYHERSYRTITPEGGFSDYVTKFEDEDGNAAETMVTWGSFATIEKALSILENGSFKNISEKLGNEHKVRNFYNNIIDPNNADGHVTIDTHAIAAAMFKALSGKAVEVSHNFGTTPPGVTGASENNETGASGTYGLFADAYRDAAAQRGLLAREMQSITWEAVRSLFPASQKKVMQPKIEAVWDKFKAKKIDRAEAERQVLEISGGLRPMQWEGHDKGKSAADGATSFSHDKNAPRTLPPSNTKEKVTVSMSAYTTSIPALRQLRNMAAKGDAKAHTLLQNIALDAAKEMFKGTSAKIKADFVTGLYGGATEPSLSVAVTFNHAERNEIMARLKQFADTFDQEQVHVLRQAKEKLGHVYQDGSYATPVYRWDLNQALSAKEVAKVIKDSGLYGLTFNDSFVTAYFVDQPSATKKDGTPYTHEEQQDDFTAGAEKARVALGAKVAKAGRSVARLWAYGDRGDGAVGWPGVRSGVSAEQGIRTESVRVAKQYIDATKATPKLSPARYEQPATDGGVAGQDRPSDRRLGQVDVTGTHYSREQRQHLSGVFFGTGLNAEEGKRIQEAKDQRLKSRLYAYVNEGQGVFPEAGVGAYAHTVKLDNLYDLKADPLGIRQKTRDANDRESLILDAGFDGYYAPGIFGRQGVAILMGGAATRGVTPTSTVAPAVSASEAQKPARRTDLPLGQMTGAEWKKLEPRATDLEDGKSYYRSDLKFSPARVQSENELPDQQPGNRTLDGAELKALRRAASRLEDPERGVTFRVTEDGQAIVTGPARFHIPDRFQRFAEENGLTFKAERGSARMRPNGEPERTRLGAMPENYRGDGALYAQEMRDNYDRTGLARFSPPRWYFSPLEKAFESAPDRVFTTAPQVKLWLAGNKAKLGLKDDEIFWTGINDFLDMQGNQKVSKADVLGYLAGNGVQVEEVMKGVQGYDENDPQLPVGSGMRVIEATDGVEGYEVLAKNGRVIGVGKTEADAISDAYSGNPEHWEGSEATKFGQYTLPGGTNYRELLLTLPNQSQYLKFKTELAKKYGFYGKMFAPIGSRATEAELAKLERLEADDVRLGRGAEKYKSSHWEEPNILAHIRMNDRTDADGNKVLFIEELQSDWGQEGKKNGFGSNKALTDEQLARKKELQNYLRFAPVDTDGIEAIRSAQAEFDSLKPENKTPDAPFVTDTKAWLGLAVKRIMAYAAANGYEKVAFISGAQSADRYDLSKQVDSIAWRKNGAGSDKIVTIEMPQGTTELFINKDGMIGRTGRLLSDANGKQLDDVIGKEITEKVLSEDEGNLSGDGLKVGGSGMVAFYDRIVPQVVSDQLKKVGGKIELSVIGQPDPVKDINQFLGRWKSSSEALNAVVNNGVISARKNNQILDAVVESIPVNVVNVLSSNGISAKDFASNPKVYFDHLPANVRLAVANGFADALSLVGARARAGLRSAYEAGLDKEILPALKASDLSLDESIRIGGPSVFNQPGTRGSHGFTASSSQGTGSRAEPAGFSRGLRGDEITPAELANFVKWHRGISSNYSGDDSILLQNSFTVTPKMSGPLPLFSTRRIVGDSGRQYDQTQRDFFKDVGRDIEQKNLVERTLDFLNKDFSKKMAVGLVDQFRGLRDLGDNGQAYMLARLSKGTAGAFDALLHHGKLSLKNGVYDADTSGGFVQRLGAPLNGELDDFLWYVAANRAEKLMPSDREHLFTPAHIAAGKSLANGTTNWDYTIQTGPQAGTVTRVRKEIFDDANRVFNEFQKNTLDMAEQSGLIDGTSRKYWESEFYVPFYRVSEEDNEFIGAKMGDALVRQQAFKKLKGGTDKLNSDLLSNTLLNFSHLIEASAKNRAAKASLGAAEQIGAAQRVAPDMASYAASNGTMLPPGTKKTVWFQENGQKVEYKVTDPFVMTAITSLEYAGMRNVFMDALSKFKHWLTIGVTASPAFKVRNLIRDSLQAIGTSNLSYNPIANVREGFRQTKRDSQEYVSALASGALIRFGTMLEGNESARTRQLIRSGVKDSTILNSEGKWQKFYDKVLEPCITAYNELGNRSEEINRAALYNQLIKQGKSHAEAALLARDLMDFSMQGAFPAIRFLTQVVPFMNARLQGMYKLRRASKDNPRKMAVVTGAVAMASIALMLAYEDDDEWKRREPWDRDNYWWFKVGGEEFRIPKPFELGAIASMAERGLEYMINDEMTGERFLKETRNLVLNQLAMNPVPQAVKPIIDLYANKDSFTGRPIESMSMQRLDPTMRYNSNTSMTARAASNAVGGALSPVQVDHLVRGYFAWLGAFVNGGADMAWRAMSNEPTKPTMDYWKFATQGIVQETDSAGSRYVTQVYEQAKELERAHATWKRLIKDGKVEEATAYREDHADELRRYKQVEAVKKIESNLNDRIHRIEISAIDPDLKKEQINNIKRMKEAAAKRISPGAY